MGMRGRGSMVSRLRQSSPRPSPAAARRAKAVERLNNLSRGLGVKIVEASHRRVAIVASIARIEEIIALLTMLSASRRRHVKSARPATS
jgi:hypothetical protein